MPININSSFSSLRTFSFNNVKIKQSFFCNRSKCSSFLPASTLFRSFSSTGDKSTDFKKQHNFNKFVGKDQDLFVEAPEETDEEAKANKSSIAQEGKVVFPPGTDKRPILRSEMYGLKIYLDQGPRDHLKDDGEEKLTRERFKLEKNMEFFSLPNYGRSN